MKNFNKWFWLGISAAFLGAPNGTVIKFTVGHFDPLYFNVLRFSLVAVVALPYLLTHKKLLNKTNIKYAILAGCAFAVAVIAWVEAIKLSNASYASLVTLIGPAFFITYSVKFNKETISKKTAAGISLAAAGAFIMVFLPLAAKDGILAGQFYPLATLMLLANCASYPLGTISVKKSNDAGAPMLSIIGISAIVITLINLVVMIFSQPVDTQITGGVLLAVTFSGLVVGVAHRIAAIKSYEHIGAVASSAIGYFGSFLSILIPVFVLNEKISLAMVAGGFLILAGIYVIEHHKSEHHKHFQAFRHH